MRKATDGRINDDNSVVHCNWDNAYVMHLIVWLHNVGIYPTRSFLENVYMYNGTYCRIAHDGAVTCYKIAHKHTHTCYIPKSNIGLRITTESRNSQAKTCPPRCGREGTYCRTRHHRIYEITPNATLHITLTQGTTYNIWIELDVRDGTDKTDGLDRCVYRFIDLIVNRLISMNNRVAVKKTIKLNK